MSDKPATRHYGTLYSTHGRKLIEVGCGVCGERMQAYAWSLAGSGKLCPACGSLVCERQTFPRPPRTVEVKPRG